MKVKAFFFVAKLDRWEGEVSGKWAGKLNISR